MKFLTKTDEMISNLEFFVLPDDYSIEGFWSEDDTHNFYAHSNYAIVSHDDLKSIEDYIKLETESLLGGWSSIKQIFTNDLLEEFENYRENLVGPIKPQ